MKKLLLFSLIGILAVVAIPTYVKGVSLPFWEEDITEVENIYAEDTVPELVDEEMIEDSADSDDLDVGSDKIENIGISISDLIWILDDEDTQDERPSISLNIQLKIGEKIIVIDSLAFFFVWIWLLILICFLVWLILCHIALWRIFWKAWESKWKSFIPIYNLYIIFKISDLKKWFWWIIIIALVTWILDYLLPSFKDNFSDFSWYFTDVVVIILWYRLSRSFGRSKDSAILYSLFSPICVLLLWFWSYKYQWKSEQTIVEA